MPSRIVSVTSLQSITVTHNLFETLALHPPTQPLTDFTITRVLTGPTQSRGQLSVSITNNLPDEATVLYVETMPWFVQFYLHTMSLSVDGRQRGKF